MFDIFLIFIISMLFFSFAVDVVTRLVDVCTINLKPPKMKNKIVRRKM